MSPAEASSEDRASIAALIQQQDTAWNRGDAVAFAAQAFPGVVFTNIVGLFSVGKPPFGAQHAPIFSTICKGNTLQQTVPPRGGG